MRHACMRAAYPTGCPSTLYLIRVQAVLMVSETLCTLKGSEHCSPLTWSAWCCSGVLGEELGEEAFTCLRAQSVIITVE